MSRSSVNRLRSALNRRLAELDRDIISVGYPVIVEATFLKATNQEQL